MPGKRRLLVVDDEAVICQACRRVFSRQGFQTEESTDPVEGLSRAAQNDYDGVLLDIKMPTMDGIQFLEQLRKQKPDVPVLIMTGYPSVPNAASAIRLGAADYITKPFTPEEITQAVQRMLAKRGGNGADPEVAAPPEDQATALDEGELLFLNEAWLQLEADGSASVGALPTRLRGAGIRSVVLPRIGEVVYQRLPLAGLTLEDGSLVCVPSPVSGVVVSVNELLDRQPGLLSEDPCGRGWIACICTTRLDEEVSRCELRRVLLANADEPSAREQSKQLQSLGCQVCELFSEQELLRAVADPAWGLLVFDAAAFGGRGPTLVGEVNVRAPSMKVVVVASSRSPWEAEYREQRIFYYAVEPFGDKEIVEILGAAFQPRTPDLPLAKHRKATSPCVSSISITNRNRTKVRLLAEPGLLRRDEGLGWQIRHRLDERLFPVVTTPGDASVTPADVLKTAAGCDRVMVLSAKDTGRLPGSLVRDTKPEFAQAAAESAGKVTTLTMQPDAQGGGVDGLDDGTIAALAEHIVQEMASY